MELLKAQLVPGVVVAHRHLAEYAHLDWELGEDAPHTVYPDIVRLARQHARPPAACGLAQ